MNASFKKTILETIRTALDSRDTSIALHEPVFGDTEKKYILECLDSGWVSSAGSFVDKFESQLSEYTGVKNAVAVVNGTAALHICLLLAGVKPDDEVLIPSLTFIATANAVKYCGAVPHFVDSEEKTLGLDPGRLAVYLGQTTELRNNACYNRSTGRRIKAVVPMHTFGHPVDLDPLVDVCLQFKIDLIEDAAESLGSLYKGRHTGSLGRLSALSFNGNKIITTGGGGAILTDDADLAAQARHLTTTAKLPHRWEFSHDMFGYNYRMPSLNAALGCAQLEQLPLLVERKRALASRYRSAFSGIKGVRFFTEPDFAHSNYWLNVLLLDEGYTSYRDEILALTNDAGVMTRPAWIPMHHLPLFISAPRMELPVAESLHRRLINIPSSAFLGANYV